LRRDAYVRSGVVSTAGVVGLGVIGVTGAVPPSLEPPQAETASIVSARNARRVITSETRDLAL